MLRRYYPAILESLSDALAKESDAVTRDNIVGAIARLMIVNYLNLPLEQMFPIFVEQLPLKEDFVEHEAVFRSILVLYQAGHAVLPPHIHTLLKVAVSVLHEKKTGSKSEFISKRPPVSLSRECRCCFNLFAACNIVTIVFGVSIVFCQLTSNIRFLFAEATNLIIEFIKSTQRDFPNDWNAFSSELPAEVVMDIQRMFS